METKEVMKILKNKFQLKYCPLFDSIREFCFSLGENVVEDVRMHRVVFCKSMTFRWFADVEPQKDGVIIKIQKNRKEPFKLFKSKKTNKFQNLEKL